MTDRALSHPWLRVQRLIRSILEVRRDEVTRPVMKARRAAGAHGIPPLPGRRAPIAGSSGVVPGHASACEEIADLLRRYSKYQGTTGTWECAK